MLIVHAYSDARGEAEINRAVKQGVIIYHLGEIRLSKLVSASALAHSVVHVVATCKFGKNNNIFLRKMINHHFPWRTGTTKS